MSLKNELHLVIEYLGDVDLREVFRGHHTFSGFRSGNSATVADSPRADSAVVAPRSAIDVWIDDAMKTRLG